MQHHDIVEQQLDVAELAYFENTAEGQAQYLDGLRTKACNEQRAALLTDPRGHVLACSDPDGLLHLLVPVVVCPVASEKKRHPQLKDAPEHFINGPERGVYATARRLFYVTHTRRAFLVRAPDVGWTLQLIYILPDDAKKVTDEHDELLALIDAAETLKYAID
jgi:hypothetical protein